MKVCFHLTEAAPGRKPERLIAECAAIVAENREIVNPRPGILGMMYLKVFVTADAKRESVEEKDDTLVICVKEPARGNRANERVRQLVASRFGVPPGHVRIFSGHHTRGKMLSIRD